MILNESPTNEAILSNVGTINSFTIKATAKSFKILSDGLYANKIRAIVRELSCNAYDSHVAAGKLETPFDVHLPNQLEPWFAVRDYGVGLSNSEVTNIFTTFFESTKTDSNAFIGALGLGSKSPFSYTDNFTVTAIKDGHKGIYSAFINDQGVPSIARMFEESTDEPAGVEVKFSVNDRYDFDKFMQEARRVYTYFKLRPVVTGSSYFQFVDQTYDDTDIVPGVHHIRNNSSSIAVMGNIGYPIDIPQADTTLGNLRSLLKCGLEIHFEIGDLDFQASREGLSYIPQTVNSIKRKLELLNTRLALHISEEADKIENLWERAYFLNKRKEAPLWNVAVSKYIVDTKFPLMDNMSTYRSVKELEFKVEDLADKFNITINGFEKGRSDSATYKMSARSQYVRTVNGTNVYEISWRFGVTPELHFVTNQGKVGASERAKHHWKSNSLPSTEHRNRVLVLERADKTKEAKFDDFFKAIFNPPENVIHGVDSLDVKPKASSGLVKNVTILKLERKDAGGGYYNRRDGDEMVWRDAGQLSTFDDKAVHYYIPLSGFNAVDVKCNSIKELHGDLQECGIKEFAGVLVYGVRKGDLEAVKALKNWINMEDFISATLTTFSSTKLSRMAVESVDGFGELRYNNDIYKNIVNKASPYIVLSEKFKGIQRNSFSKSSIDRLCKQYGSGTVIDMTAERAKIMTECKEVADRYPLLKYVAYGNEFRENAAVIEYINMVDSTHGV